MDRLLVVRDSDGKYIVLEGNRRTVALKILKNPAVLTGLDLRPALQKRFEAAAQNFDLKSVEPLACYEIDRATGNAWLYQRHNGADEGRGVVDWSSIVRQCTTHSQVI